MTQIIVFAVLALLAIATFVWVLNAMLTHFCPTCYDEGVEENLIPILPYVRWWCPACSNVHKHGEVLYKGAEDKKPHIDIKEKSKENPSAQTFDDDLPPRI